MSNNVVTKSTSFICLLFKWLHFVFHVSMLPFGLFMANGAKNAKTDSQNLSQTDSPKSAKTSEKCKHGWGSVGSSDVTGPSIETLVNHRMESPYGLKR